MVLCSIAEDFSTIKSICSFCCSCISSFCILQSEFASDECGDTHQVDRNIFHTLAVYTIRKRRRMICCKNPDSHHENKSREHCKSKPGIDFSTGVSRKTKFLRDVFMLNSSCEVDNYLYDILQPGLACFVETERIFPRQRFKATSNK